MFGRRSSNADRRVPRKDRKGLAPIAAGALGTIVILLILFFGFTKKLPFTHNFRVKGVFTSATSIRKNSPVRIAGVNVGVVKGIERYRNTPYSVITMELKDQALPVHSDATMAIRPRIFLEGNFFVDLKPGSPQGHDIHDGETIPVTQTSTPVQLDQVLTALQSDTRADLQDLIQNLGQAFDQAPGPGEDASQDPEVRGLTGGQALNKSLQYTPDALRGTAIVNRALLGTQPHDLSKILRNLGVVSKALNARESSLQGLITNFNKTVAATASQSTNLRAGLRILSPTLVNVRRTLTDLDASFPATRAFAREILPGVRATPGTINAAFPWVRQTEKLLGPNELQGVARYVRPLSQATALLVNRTVLLLPQIDLVNRCLKDVILPTGDEKITVDPVQNAQGVKPIENYKEFWKALVGLSGETANFDGNRGYTRFQVGGGLQAVSGGTGKFSGSLGSTTGSVEGLVGAPGGTKSFGNQPVVPLNSKGVIQRPPYRSDVPCYTNPIPQINKGLGIANSEQTTSAAGSGPSNPFGLPNDINNLLTSVTSLIPVKLPPLLKAPK